MSEPLPSPTENKRTLTFAVPHILLKREERDGFPVLQVRLGGNRQIEFTISSSYSETEIEETLFIIKATNKINFGDGSISVLNDAMENLSASSPTATEYLGNVGKTVTTAFSCKPDPHQSKLLGRDVFKVVKTTITIP